MSFKALTARRLDQHPYEIVSVSFWVPNRDDAAKYRDMGHGFRNEAELHLALRPQHEQLTNDQETMLARIPMSSSATWESDASPPKRLTQGLTDATLEQIATEGYMIMPRSDHIRCPIIPPDVYDPHNPENTYDHLKDARESIVAFDKNKAYGLRFAWMADTVQCDLVPDSAFQAPNKLLPGPIDTPEVGKCWLFDHGKDLFPRYHKVTSTAKSTPDWGNLETGFGFQWYPVAPYVDLITGEPIAPLTAEARLQLPKREMPVMATSSSVPNPVVQAQIAIDVDRLRAGVEHLQLPGTPAEDIGVNEKFTLIANAVSAGFREFSAIGDDDFVGYLESAGAIAVEDGVIAMAS